MLCLKTNATATAATIPAYPPHLSTHLMTAAASWRTKRMPNQVCDGGQNGQGPRAFATQTMRSRRPPSHPNAAWDIYVKSSFAMGAVERERVWMRMLMCNISACEISICI